MLPLIFHDALEHVIGREHLTMIGADVFLSLSSPFYFFHWATVSQQWTDAAFQTARKSEFPSSFFWVTSTQRSSEL